MTGESVQIRGTDALIAIGFGLEWTQERIAEFAGCTDRTVRNRRDIEGVQWLKAKVQSAIAADQSNFERKTRDHYEALMEQRLEEAIKKGIDGSLKSNELKDHQWAFDRITDRVMGKPTQRQEISGGTENRVIFEIPAELTTRYIDAKRETLGLPAPSEVIDAEVVSDGAGGGE